MNKYFKSKLENKFNIMIINHRSFSGAYRASFDFIYTKNTTYGESINYTTNILLRANERYEDAINERLCILNLKDEQKEKEEALIAVSNNGHSIKYLSEELKEDNEIISKALETHPWSITYINTDLISKELFLKTVERIEKKDGLEKFKERLPDIYLEYRKLKREEELLARLKENEVVPEFANKNKDFRQVKRKI